MRRRRRSVRSRAARVRAAGVDQRRHRRHRTPPHPVGHLDGISAELDGRPRRRRPEPPDGPDHADRDTCRRGVLRCRSGTSLTRQSRPREQAPSLPRSRSTRPSRPVPARPVRPFASPFEGTATRPPGWSSPPTLNGDRQLRPASTGQYPPSTGCGCVDSIPPVYRVSGWPERGALVRDNGGLRGGDELMRVGLSLGADRHDADKWGDFKPGCSSSRRSRRTTLRGAPSHPFTVL